MDARRVAGALDGYWPVRVGKRPADYNDYGAPWPVIAEMRAGYPSRTASLAGEVPPVLVLGRRPVAEPVDITADRPRLTLTDPSQARSTPLLAHHASVLALTAYDTAELLEAFAANGDNRRALAREVAAYRGIAAHAESLLDVSAVSALIAKAEAATRHALIPPPLAQPRKVPIR